MRNSTASLVRESWSVCWPMAMIMFFVFLIGITDVYVAGIFGKEVQAAYGVVFQVFFILSIIATALSVGSVSLVSRLFTAGRKEEFAEAVDTSLALALVMGAVCSAVGWFGAGAVTGFFRLPPSVSRYAEPLMRLYAASLLFNYVLVTTNGILRASKMVLRSLLTMAAVSAANIGLIFFLAFHTSLGFKGIAVATLLSHAFGSALNLLFVRKLMRPVMRVSLAKVADLLRISWPAGLLQILWQLSTTTLYLIIAALPRDTVEVMAAFTNGLRIEAAIFLPAFAFNMANAVVVGNLLGKGSEKDAYRIAKVTAGMGVAVVVLLTAGVLFNASAIAHRLSGNAQVAGECVRYIRISLLLEPVMAWGVILGGALNGAGDTKSVMYFVVASVWLVRIPLGYFLAITLGFGPAGIWWAMNASIVMQSILLTRHFRARKWMGVERGALDAR